MSQHDMSTLPRIPMSVVEDHCTPKSCWIVINNLVLDITSFLHKHPGSSEILLENAGRDCTNAFKSTRHSAEAQALLKTFAIGIVDKA